MDKRKFITTHNLKATQTGDVLELPEERVSEDGAENRCEVAEHVEGVVHHGGSVIRVAQLISQVDGQDGCQTE